MSSDNDPQCVDSTCLTLAQFEREPPDSNTTLFIIGGRHTLDREISISNYEAFSMVSFNDSVLDSVIVCINDSSHLNFTLNGKVFISGLKFVGCDDIIFAQLLKLTIENSLFLNSTKTTLTSIDSHVEILSSHFIGSMNGISKDDVEWPRYLRFHAIFESFRNKESVGGALVVINGTVLVDSCHFESNRASVGGALYSDLGSDVIVINSSFISNVATDDDHNERLSLGGALFIGQNAHSTTIRDCLFLNNTSDQNGGAIALYNSTHLRSHQPTSIEIINSTFQCNNAVFGGAMFLHSSRAKISGSSFLSNIATAMGGAVVSSTTSSIVIADGLFALNQAMSDGGVLYIEAASAAVVSGGKFFNNSASGDGGVTYVVSNSTVSVNNSIFSSNAAQKDGGVMFIHNVSTAMVNHSRFIKNSAGNSGGVLHLRMNSTGNVARSVSFHNNSARDGGVAFLHYASSIMLADCSFDNNHAKSEAGVVKARSWSAVVVHSSVFRSNTAGIYGGSVHIKENSSIAINTSFFYDNSAFDGAVINAYSSTYVHVCKSNFANNSAVIFGGVISCKLNSECALTESFFEGNTAQDLGAVVYSEDESVVHVHHCHFTYNSAGHGGVLSVMRNTSVTVMASRFQYNIAYTDGGCIFARWMCTVTINSSILANNRANNNGIVRASIKSSVTISNATFRSNQVGHDGACAYVHDASSLAITVSFFTNNRANNSGGVVYVRKRSNLTITDSIMEYSTAENSGGAVCAQDTSIVVIEESNFTKNSAEYGAVVRMYIRSILQISGCNFSDNTAYISGGIIATYKKSTVSIRASNFDSNTATYGGVVIAYQNSQVLLSNVSCTNHRAKSGGVIRGLQGSKIEVISSRFSHNSAELGAVLCMQACVTIIEDCTFESSNADLDGGVIYTDERGTVSAERAVFANNSARRRGGVVYLSHSYHTSFSSCEFINNRASESGGVVNQESSNVTIYKCTFHSSRTGKSGGVIWAVNSSISINDSLLFNSGARLNGGAVDVHTYSNVTVFNSTFTNNTAERSGGALYFTDTSSSAIDCCIFQYNHAGGSGGAVTVSVESTVNISGSDVVNNTATIGAAIVARESSSISFIDSRTEFTKNPIVILRRNKADVGGAIYVSDGIIIFGTKTTIYRNRAEKQGGGIHAVRSQIVIGSTVNVSNNRATQGGGISVAKSSVLNDFDDKLAYTISFMNNIALQGASIYVDDDNEHDSDICMSDPFSGQHYNNSGCFFQNVTTGLRMQFDRKRALHYPGLVLFGGMLDRCTVVNSESPSQLEQNGVARFLQISSINTVNGNRVSSRPMRVCQCRNGIPNCVNQSYSVSVRKGNVFSVQVVAVDQVGHSVSATIQSLISHQQTSGLGKVSLPQNQTRRKVESKCSDLDYSLIPPRIGTYGLTLFAEDGPCRETGISSLLVNVIVEPCSCVPGFMQDMSVTHCSCICDKRDATFSTYIKECNSETRSVIRNGVFWITYLKQSSNENVSGYFIYPYCPLGYCHPPSSSIPIRLYLPNGSDAQCANDRAGLLCGTCKSHYSLSIGSSKCVKCSDSWGGPFAAIVIAALLGGIMLVLTILVLNLTVATGTLNSIIFYVNITYANRDIFFNHWQLDFTFTPVFISWMNLDVGFNACFFDGMDMYAKTWLQLAFPAYIFFLVIMIILITSYSTRISNLIGKRNPVATLATLVLLSYTKLLETIIRSFSFAHLKYPNGTMAIKWLPDATVGYSEWKMIVLICTAIVILSVGLLYTLLIFSWQWLLRCSQSRFFKWTKNQKLHAFICTYHAPHTAKHRYWTGLLLLVRVIIYLVSAFTLSIDPRITLLTTAVIMCCLFFFKTVLVARMYKNVLINAMESFILFNITIFVFLTWYNFDNSSGLANKELLQLSVVYICVGSTFVLFLVVFLYHSCKYGCPKIYSICQNTKLASKVHDHLLVLNDNRASCERLDGVSYRLFDAIDNSRDVDSEVECHSRSSIIELLDGPTHSAVSMNDCDGSDKTEFPPSKNGDIN